MLKSIKPILFLFLFVTTGMVQAQVSFNRSIQKIGNSDTIELSYQIQKHQNNEICRIQQKIPSAFSLINIENVADTVYFDKDIATMIWVSLPKDTLIGIKIALRAPQKTLGYIYMGDCACYYGGKTVAPIRKHIPKEKIWLIDTLLIPAQDSTLYTQIDSISNQKIKIVKGKKHKKTTIQKIKSPYSYRIQISATKFKQELKDLNKDVIAPDHLYEEHFEDFYKYSIGPFKTYKEAKQRLSIYELHKTKGYIVAYKNGSRITIKEASEEDENEIITQ